MNLEVIVATIEQTDYSLHERMNISSDALICNQHNTESFHSIDWKGKCVRYLSTKESGAGINRNQGLLRAKGDILLFADDDMVYHDSYEKLVLEAFHQLPNADMIFFNVDSSGDPIKRESIERITRVRKHNAFRYGT
ncbi:MAG TPA: hypothetical protein DIW17_18295, partial [Clostridiales bacterium]|nr:hypothetical protein [Clostridiales bacterium]